MENFIVQHLLHAKTQLSSWHVACIHTQDCMNRGFLKHLMIFVTDSDDWAVIRAPVDAWKQIHRSVAWVAEGQAIVGRLPSEMLHMVCMTPRLCPIFHDPRQALGLGSARSIQHRFTTSLWHSKSLLLYCFRRGRGFALVYNSRRYSIVKRLVQ